MQFMPGIVIRVPPTVNILFSGDNAHDPTMVMHSLGRIPYGTGLSPTVVIIINLILGILKILRSLTTRNSTRSGLAINYPFTLI